MPFNRIKSSGRASAAIAAVMAVATAIGGVWYVKGPDGQQIPAAVVLAVDNLVKPWEGRELKAYWDSYGKVWTICDGDTQNVRKGTVETPAGCDERLTRRMMTEFYPALKKCIASFETKPVSWQAMMVSLSWNVGSRAACNSTAARLGRAGKYYDSCVAATAWNKAGGRVLIGLVRRREMGDATRMGEAELCVTGL